MWFKRYLPLLLIIGDTFLLVWLIGLIGFKYFGKLCLGYIIGLLLTSVILRLFGVLEPEDWKLVFRPKVPDWLKGIFFICFIIIGVLLSYWKPHATILVGMWVGFMTVSFMAFLCKDLLKKLWDFYENLDFLIPKKWGGKK